jgi:hypothetical protein
MNVPGRDPELHFSTRREYAGRRNLKVVMRFVFFVCLCGEKFFPCSALKHLWNIDLAISAWPGARQFAQIVPVEFHENGR